MEYHKTSSSCVNHGIKKGIAVGRKVIDVGRDVARRLADIPVLGKVASQLVNNPLVETVDRGLRTAETIRKGVEEIANRLPN